MALAEGYWDRNASPARKAAHAAAAAFDERVLDWVRSR